MAAPALASSPTLATHSFGSQARRRNQLLPRYWPRITDQELQQISGDSNSVITPLFKKKLSARDAGKTGRLKLPKKCAEAYFPSISQPQGLPLKVQDAKGSEWIFQFRFWRINNSRMYVLEGVAPCIRSMQLQAGDIVTFSRLEPEGKLVMGFRKASTAPPSDQGTSHSMHGNFYCAELGPGKGLLQPRVLGGQAREAREGMKLGPVEKLENGIAGPNSDEHLNPCKINPQQSASVKEDPSTPPYGLAVPHASGNEPNGHIGLVGPHFRPALSPMLAKRSYGSMLNDTNSSGESHTRNKRPRGDARGRNQLLPRYWPRITDQEPQQISGDSNSVITPLFKKKLSAKDAGKTGRLELPKKCAEAYFPSISQPQGLPLKVQDAKGSEWIFQFRFWRINNSRMYVLEGVAPCIRSMQLQAGDIVTFSRLEPEGKLVMGFRKASTAPPSDHACFASGESHTRNRLLLR